MVLGGLFVVGPAAPAFADHPADCLDGADNDGDGHTDVQDPQCQNPVNPLYKENGSGQTDGQCDASDDEVRVSSVTYDIGTSPASDEEGPVSRVVHSTVELFLWHARAVPLVFAEKNVHAVNCVVVVGIVESSLPN